MRCIGRTLLSLFVTLALSGALESAEAAFIRGDANADTKVDIGDPVFTLAYSFRGGAAPVCEDAADANDDGALDISDAIYTLFYLFQGSKAPPAPYPAPGVDSTPDSLHCGGDGSAGHGTLLVAIHDTPPDALTEFWITIEEVKVLAVDGSSLDVFPPESDPEATKTVNLLDTVGASSIIASILVPSGDYAGVSVEFDHAFARAGADDVTVVPDHGEVNLTFQAPVTVSDGTLTALLIDFNLSASLTDGGEDKVLLDPVLTADDDEDDDDDEHEAELSEFHGKVVSVDAASNSFVVELAVHKRRHETPAVAGQVTVVVDDNTEFEDGDGLASLQPGQEVEVKGDLRADGTILARKVELKSDDDGEDLNDDGVDDGDEGPGNDTDIDNDGTPNHDDEDDDNDGVSDDDDHDDNNDGIDDDSDPDHNHGGDDGHDDDGGDADAAGGVNGTPY